MKVITWNCHRARASSPLWEYFLELDPDLALLQEVTSVPPEVRTRFKVTMARPVNKRGEPQKFASAIIAREQIGDETPLRCTQREWVAAELRHFAGNLISHRVHVGERPMRAVGVYSPAWPVDRERLAGIDVAEVKLENNRDVWVTELVWCALQELPLHEPLVVGGDFNSSETFDHLWPGGPRGNREFLDRMEALGLTECLRHAQGKLTPTFRNSRGGKVIHQMDHLFVTAPLLSALKACNVGDADRVFGGRLSDHLPIIAEFEIASVAAGAGATE